MRRPEIQPSTPRFAERTAIATAAQPIRNRLLIALKREVVEFLRRGHPDTDPTGQLVLLSRVLVPLGKLHVRVHLNGRSRADFWRACGSAFWRFRRGGHSVVATVALGWGRD